MGVKTECSYDNYNTYNSNNNFLKNNSLKILGRKNE